MHLFHEMYEGDALLATGEHFLLHVSLETRKPRAPAPDIEAALVRVASGHARLPTLRVWAVRLARPVKRVLITAGAVGHRPRDGRGL